MAWQSGTVLDEPEVQAAIRQAWLDSQPGSSGGHEEGGFVVQDANGELRVVRWPGGAQSSIAMPFYSSCKIGQDDIVATFHTHPNTGTEYLQEPSETDRLSVRDDPDLKGQHYEGEFVISQEFVHLVAPDGSVSRVGSTSDLWNEVGR